MGEVLIDFCVFAAALSLVCAGYAAGWKLRGQLDRLDEGRAELNQERARLEAERKEEERRRTEAVRQTEPPDEETRRKLREQAEAFKRLQSYSPEDAYGLNEQRITAEGGGS